MSGSALVGSANRLVVRPEMMFRGDMKDERTAEALVAFRDWGVDVVRQVFVPDVHYGTIPGTAKATLFKAGAEWWCTSFGLRAHDIELRSILTDDHILYEIQVELRNWQGEVVSEGRGLCSSREPKIRYMTTSGVCPACSSGAAIRKSKPPKPAGYYCWGKVGGCGAEFSGDSDEAKLIKASSGRTENLDIWGSAHNILRIATKRGFVAAVQRLAGGLLEVALRSDWRPAAAPPARGQQRAPERERPAPGKPAGPAELGPTQEQLREINRQRERLRWSPEELDATVHEAEGAHPGRLPRSRIPAVIAGLRATRDASGHTAEESEAAGRAGLVADGTISQLEADRDAAHDQLSAAERTEIAGYLGRARRLDGEARAEELARGGVRLEEMLEAAQGRAE